MGLPEEVEIVDLKNHQRECGAGFPACDFLPIRTADWKVRPTLVKADAS
jgi:hypothetical protein